jgi:PAS domain S-box-containing protein
MGISHPKILKLLKEKNLNLETLSPELRAFLKEIETEFKNDKFSKLEEHLEELRALGLQESDIDFYLQENYTAPVTIVTESGLQIFLNEKYETLLGYEKIELLNKSGADLFTSESLVIVRQKIALRKDGFADIYEATMKKKNGELINVKIDSRALFDSNKKMIGVFCVLADITNEKKLEEKLRLNNEELEATIQKRTRELTIANYHMVSEIKERKLSEIALKNSEKRFKDLFYSSPESIFVEDFDGTILDVNESAAILHECSREEMIGKNISEFTDNFDATGTTFEERQHKLVLGDINYFEAFAVGKNKTKTPVAVKSAIIEFNNSLALLLHARDISDRIKHEKELEKMNLELEEKVKERTNELEKLNTALQSEISIRANAEIEIAKQKDFLRLLIDMNPSRISVKDKDGKFIMVNDAFAKSYYTTPQAIVDLYQNDLANDNEVNKMFAEQDKLVLSTNKEQIFDNIHIKDIRGNETYLHIVKKPITSLKDNSKNVLGISTDITESKRTEEKIRQSEQLYRQIARNVPNSAIFIFNKDLKYILAEGSLVGIVSPSKEALEGKTIYEISKGAKDLASRKENYSKVLEGESLSEQSAENGRDLITYFLPIKNEESEIIYGMVIVLDISDIKKIQNELEEKAANLKRSNEELERFAYVASHDLQSPLRTISSYMQLLEQRYGEHLGEDAKDFISFSVSGAKRMQLLITDLLNYSRINSVTRPYQEVNVNDLLFVIKRGLESTIKAKKAIIQYDKLPTIMAEPYQLSQLLQNLVDNAMKFVKDKEPKIEISFQENANDWQFSVKDNGIGIKPEFQEKVFYIFQRLHSEDAYAGTGIGLAICKKVVDLHNGKIWFESKYGSGTTFYFTISKLLKNKEQEVTALS